MANLSSPSAQESSSPTPQIDKNELDEAFKNMSVSPSGAPYVNMELSRHSMQKYISHRQQQYELQGGGSTIKSATAGNLARELGCSPSLEEMKTFVDGIGAECDLNLFQKFCNQVIHPEDTVDNLIVLFQNYDAANTGTISQQALRNILQSLGEPLSDEEMDELIKDVCEKKDPVDYKNLVMK